MTSQMGIKATARAHRFQQRINILKNTRTANMDTLATHVAYLSRWLRCLQGHWGR